MKIINVILKSYLQLINDNYSVESKIPYWRDHYSMLRKIFYLKNDSGDMGEYDVEQAN